MWFIRQAKMPLPTSLPCKFSQAPMDASPEGQPLRPAAVAVDVSPVPSMSSSLTSDDNSNADVYFNMVRYQHDTGFVPLPASGWRHAA